MKKEEERKEFLKNKTPRSKKKPKRAETRNQTWTEYFQVTFLKFSWLIQVTYLPLQVSEVSRPGGIVEGVSSFGLVSGPNVRAEFNPMATHNLN